MESLYLLIPVSLVFIGVGIGLFFWAVKGGQYEDIDREGERILFDDNIEQKQPEQARGKTIEEKDGRQI